LGNCKEPKQRTKTTNYIGYDKEKQKTKEEDKEQRHTRQKKKRAKDTKSHIDKRHNVSSSKFSWGLDQLANTVWDRESEVQKRGLE
jgi:hypothetical protein